MLGIYQNLRNEDYHAHVGSVSRSGLMEFRRSPYHYWAAYLNPNRPQKEANDALILGNALHTLVLEPNAFHERYIAEFYPSEKVEKQPLLRDVGRAMFEEAKSRIYAQKERIEAARQEFMSRAEGKIILDDKMYNTVVSMFAAIQENEQATQTIDGCRYENSIFWRDKETGILCKVRPDFWADNYIGDLKTAASADERSFQNAIAAYGYHIQAAMMREAVRETTGKIIENFIYIVCEKAYPFCVVPYILDKEAIDKGHDEFRLLLRGFKHCQDMNEWPAYEAKTISLPGWYQ